MSCNNFSYLIFWFQNVPTLSGPKKQHVSIPPSCILLRHSYHFKFLSIGCTVKVSKWWPCCVKPTAFLFSQVVLNFAYGPLNFPSNRFCWIMFKLNKLSVWSRLKHFSVYFFLSITLTPPHFSCLRTIMLLFLDKFSTIFRNLHGTRIQLYLSQLFFRVAGS